MLEQRIQQQFFESADLQYQAADTLVRPIADAVQALVGVLTAGGRVWIVGLGPCAALAQWLAQAMTGRFERDRPGLAAAVLGADAVSLGSCGALGGGELGLGRVLARQVEALGQPGDLLLVLDADSALQTPAAAVAAAQGKDMTVVAVTGRNGGALAEALGETDVLVAVPHDRRARVLEAQLLVLHCLCDAVDLQLLGEQDNT